MGIFIDVTAVGIVGVGIGKADPGLVTLARRGKNPVTKGLLESLGQGALKPYLKREEK